MGGNNKCGQLIPPMIPNDPGLMPVRYGIGNQFAHATTALLFNVERIEIPDSVLWNYYAFHLKLHPCLSVPVDVLN